MLGNIRLMERIGTGRPLERQIGFSRVVVAGGLVAVSGCAPTKADGSSAGGPDQHRQAASGRGRARLACVRAGCDDAVVHRALMCLPVPAVGESVVRAPGEVVAGKPPAATLVVGKGLLRPEGLVEIEADAVRPV